jgi:type II secretory pathway predicted ATPase ExeA
MIAPPGMGKTTVLYYLCEKLQPRADLAFLLCSFDDKYELLQAVMASLGVEADNGSYFQNWLRLYEFLLQRAGQNRKVVLICDEAQSLSLRTLEDIRLLSNFETPQTRLLQIILAGQPALLQKLEDPELEQLRQRINVSCGITPLGPEEVEAYIQHRLQVAGRARRLFAGEAVSTIARLSHGIPRNINTLCYNAMALASALGRRHIDEELVQSTASSLLIPDAVSRPQARPGPLAGQRAVRAHAALQYEEDLAAVGNLSHQLSRVLRKLERFGEVLEKLRVDPGPSPALEAQKPSEVAVAEVEPCRPNGHSEGERTEMESVVAEPQGRA